MTFFKSATGPLRTLLIGNSLLLICFLCYLVWWGITFRPNWSSGLFGTVCLLGAFVAGTTAIAFLCNGIKSFCDDSMGFPVRYILLGVAVLFFILFLVTSILFQRIVTSELIIIHLWLALELSVINVLFHTGNLDSGRAAMLVALVFFAFAVSMICYVLYYQLSGLAGYYDGMIPLILASMVSVVLYALLNLS